ncbi:hypothetical protein K5549_014966 [Capra hircus]|nr:hypothetical protein K5549_014966 [Capra hircus]
MEAEDNISTVIQFVLLGFSDLPNLQALLFGVFSIIYIIILTGNSLTIILSRLDPALQKPMYFFLANFFSLEICYSSFPKCRSAFSQNKSISYHSCAQQFYIFCAFADTKSFILAAMAYDHYVAICTPLLYTAVMCRDICIWLIVLSYFGGNMSSLVHTSFTFILKYCDKDVINHFFFLDTSLIEWLLSTYSSSVEIICFLVIIISYFYILLSVLKIHSSSGRKKTFFTCTSHLTSVAIYQGTLLFVYSRPSYLYSPNTDKIISVFYTIIIPVLNPLIYSLRNRDIKDASKKVLEPKIHPS